MLYNLKDVKNDLEKELSDANALLSAWENVKFNVKKDGTPYSSIQRNFENASYGIVNGLHNALQVYAYASRYVEDYIRCYDYETESYISVEKMKAKIVERKTELKNRIASLKYQIANVETAYNEFQSAYNAALEKLSENLGGCSTGFNDIKQAVIQYI